MRFNNNFLASLLLTTALVASSSFAAPSTVRKPASSDLHRRHHAKPMQLKQRSGGAFTPVGSNYLQVTDSNSNTASNEALMAAGGLLPTPSAADVLAAPAASAVTPVDTPTTTINTMDIIAPVSSDANSTIDIQRDTIIIRVKVNPSPSPTPNVVIARCKLPRRRARASAATTSTTTTLLYQTSIVVETDYVPTATANIDALATPAAPTPDAAAPVITALVTPDVMAAAPAAAAAVSTGAVQLDVALLPTTAPVAAIVAATTASPASPDPTPAAIATSISTADVAIAASTTAPAVVPAATPAASTGHTFQANSLQKNNIHIGFLPDDGSGGGQSQSMAEILSSLGGAPSATFGWYAQAHSGTLFDGSQLLAQIEHVVASGAIYQPAVMPIGGWQGLTYGDNSQAVAIAQVMKQFTDRGVTVWLRFAHEVNWYQSDGTYQGNAADFKEGWAVVAAAIKQYAPLVKMFFTPNVASLEQYDQFYPNDHSSVDIIGIDYYPSDAGSMNFIDTMKPFHDKYASPTTAFAIGETGLGMGADIATRLAWFQQTTSAAALAALPYYNSVTWFNYQKGYNFKIAGTDGDSIVASYLSS